MLASTTALADTAPDKLDAKALMQSGVKLFEAKDYLGALAIFKDAYARFPSAKILLNIGTTLRALSRDAEAANVYQRYLDSPDADRAKRAEVQAALAELDKNVGRLDLTIIPADGEVQVNSDDWIAADKLAHARVPAGRFTVRARKTGFDTAAKSATIEAGDHLDVGIALAVTPKEIGIDVKGSPEVAIPPPQLVSAAPAAPPPSRLGAFAFALVDTRFTGAAGLVGLSGDVTETLALRAAAILGPTFGGYAGATFAILPGKWRPVVSAGMPVFASSHVVYGVRGAVGLEVRTTPSISLTAEVGYEHYLNSEMTIDASRIIPAIGISGKL